MRRRRPQPVRRNSQKRPKINEQITAPEVLLVIGEGKSEKMPIADAIARAKEQELDLIEVSGKTDPPVVKIGEFGHYLYQLQKKERRARAHAKQTEVKTLRLSFRTERHDLDRILTRAKEFFAQGHLVKLVVRLRGRERSNPQYAKDKLQSLISDLGDSAAVDQDMKKQGFQYIVVLRGKK